VPATPAWPLDSGPRLFVDQPLASGAEVALEAGQANYLVNVMRLKPGAAVRAFDDRNGEYAATLQLAGKRDTRLAIGARLRDRESVPDLWLAFAPIKRARVDWLAEKACELGVARLVPVLTRRTVVDKLNLERLRAHMIEAAEQCGRTALPELAEPIALDALLRNWPDERALVFADETGGVPFGDAAPPAPAALLIGPEGGFDPAERDAIRALPQATGVSLGPRILRAETAALATISVWMSARGDWRP